MSNLPNTPVQSNLEAYYQETRNLEPFGGLIKNLLQELLSQASISIHTIEYRVKQYDSASRKLSSAEDRYSEFGDLTDLLGIRIITYFHDEVDKVAELIEREFSIDRENSVDKRLLIDPDRFGYLSLHFIATFNEDRCNLTEYMRYKNVKFELQIRSILQHAWAEIEHDLGYKSVRSVPRQVRRRFSRLAGLLELADDEFKQLRIELSDYEAKVEEEFNDESTVLDIDQTTVSAFIRDSKVLATLDSQVAALIGVDLTKPAKGLMPSRYVEGLIELGIHTIQALEDYLSTNGDGLVKLAVENSKVNRERGVPRTRDIPKGFIISFITPFKLFQENTPNSEEEFQRITGSSAERYQILKSIYESIST
jgi:putative GTP pyrophosphokinase